VVWMHFQERTTCSESFTSASHPIVSDVLLDVLSLNYFETLMAASGFQAEKSLKDTIANNKGKYIVPVEGAVPTDNNGVYCMIGGKTAQSILQEVSQDAAAVVAWGSCASNGCVQAAKPNPAGATPIHKLVNKPVINVPGWPPIADVMMGVVTHLLVLGQVPALDSLGGPRLMQASVASELFNVWNGCGRNSRNLYTSWVQRGSDRSRNPPVFVRERHFFHRIAGNAGNRAGKVPHVANACLH
jgi:hydrogenase small subunit